MNIIKNLTNDIVQERKLLESALKQAAALVELFPIARLGIINEDYRMGTTNTHVGKGDIVWHPDEKAAYVATGNTVDGQHEIRNRHKTRRVEPEFITPHSMAADPATKKIGGRLAIEHPTRRVHIYGPRKKEQVGEAVTNLDDNPLPTTDKGIPSEMKAPKKGDTANGSEVKNDQDMFDTFMKKAGKTTKHKTGDKDAGNPNPSVKGTK